MTPEPTGTLESLNNLLSSPAMDVITLHAVEMSLLKYLEEINKTLQEIKGNLESGNVDEETENRLLERLDAMRPKVESLMEMRLKLKETMKKE